MGILSKELKFKFLDRSFRSGVFVLILDSADLKENSVVVIGWVVVEGHETTGGGGSLYNNKGTVQWSHIVNTQANKGVAQRVVALFRKEGWYPQFQVVD